MCEIRWQLSTMWSERMMINTHVAPHLDQHAAFKHVTHDLLLIRQTPLCPWFPHRPPVVATWRWTVLIKKVEKASLTISLPTQYWTFSLFVFTYLTWMKQLLNIPAHFHLEDMIRLIIMHHMDFLFYLVESEVCVTCEVCLKLFVPVAFEVDGVDQNQPGHVVHHTLGQQILNFTCRSIINSASDSTLNIEFFCPNMKNDGEMMTLWGHGPTLRLLLHPAVDVDPGLLWFALEVHRLQLGLVVLPGQSEVILQPSAAH